MTVFFQMYIGGFGGKKNGRKKERSFFQTIFMSRPSLELSRSCVSSSIKLCEAHLLLLILRKNSPNTTYPCLCIFLHYTTILIIKRLTCSCTLECLLGLYFLAHSPSSVLYFPNTSPEYLIFFYHHRARNNIQTRPPVPIYISKHVTRS